ncbi:MAG: glycosyltransferase family 4 protein [Pseudodesulfovibrio sp.]
MSILSSSAAVASKLRILVYYDVEGWAWYHKAVAIKAHLEPEFHVDITAHNAPDVANSYDYVVVFGYYMLDVLKGVSPEKILLGLSNNGPTYIENTREALKQGRAAAGLANSRIGYGKLQGAGEVFLTENGVDTIFFHPPAHPSSGFSLCWVGNPNSDVDKGLDIIREACSAAGVELRLHTWDASKGDTSGVTPRENLRNSLYWTSTAFVCASRYDGTPNPALESLACGLPVITTRVGNMPEVVVDGVNGFFIERDVNALVAAINRLKNADLDQMRLAARQSVENGWAWEKKALNYGSAIMTVHEKGEA